MLKTNGNELYYHTFKSETSNHNYEIDFLLSDKNKTCPIEVKSSRYREHKSLDIFTKKFSKQVSKRYIIHTKELRKEGDILYLPPYLVPFL